MTIARPNVDRRSDGHPEYIGPRGTTPRGM
jgi:hypothetical protein